MNILLCSWANIFEPEIVDTFIEMGFTIDKITSPISDPLADSNYLQLISKQLLSKNYDFIFTVNYIPIVAMVCNIHKTKYISWIADSPCFELNSHTISSQFNYIFIFDKILYNYYHKISPNNIYYLPLGCNVKRLDKIAINNEEYHTYQSDISFVGSLYASRSKYLNVVLPDYWHGYFEGIIESQLLIYGYNLLDDVISKKAITAFVKAANWDSNSLEQSNKILNLNTRNLIINNYIGRECSHRERMRIIDILAKNFDFNLYTNDNTNNLAHVKNKGIIEPFVEAFKIYKSSKINLNITSKTIESGLPLRMFDIMGAGGFLITNYQSEIPDYFEIDKDLVVYENTNDLIHKISYYLSHEDERLEIASNGYSKVKSNFQFKNQILKMLKMAFDNF